MPISFILLGKYLEILAKGKSSQAIAKLIDLAPETAVLLTYDESGNLLGESEIYSWLIQKNDVIKVVPGAKVACDDFVIWGQSHSNESMISEKARPVAKRKGDCVIGGTINENGVLYVRATHVGFESALSQIVRLVQSTQMTNALIQKFADRISKYFVPLVNNKHPLDKATVEHAKKFKEEENHTWSEARYFIAVVGHGVKAMIGNKAHSGKQEFDAGHRHSNPRTIFGAHGSRGNGANRNSCFHQPPISDPLKSVAQDVISILKSMNVRSIMVTGDNWGTAKAIAREVGIDVIVAEVKARREGRKDVWVNCGHGCGWDQ